MRNSSLSSSVDNLSSSLIYYFVDGKIVIYYLKVSFEDIFTSLPCLIYTSHCFLMFSHNEMTSLSLNAKETAVIVLPILVSLSKFLLI